MKKYLITKILLLFTCIFSFAIFCNFVKSQNKIKLTIKPFVFMNDITFSISKWNNTIKEKISLAKCLKNNKSCEVIKQISIPTIMLKEEMIIPNYKIVQKQLSTFFPINNIKNCFHL